MRYKSAYLANVLSRRPRRPRFAARRRVSPLSCEPLEGRLLLTIDVQFDTATGSLTLSDVNDDNVMQLEVDYNGTQRTVRINDQSTQIASEDVRQLRVFAGNGNDLIDVSVVDFFTFPNLATGSVSIYGGPGNDQITGTGLGDAIYAGAGHDIVRGGAGDDLLLGQTGVDTIYGEQGNDALNPGKVGRLSLGGSEPNVGHRSAPMPGRPAVPTERASGGTGNDRFQFLSPDATSAVEILDDSGIDTLDFSALNHGSGLLDFDLNLPSYELVASGFRMTFSFPPDGVLENVIGTNYVDVIRGSAGHNRIDGLAGDDRLEGGAGFDVLIGSAGNDTLIGQSDDDLLQGGDGNDMYVFSTANSGFDTIDDDSGDADGLDLSGMPLALEVNLAGASLVKDRSGDSIRVTMASGQIEDVVGTELDDVIYGNDSDNVLDGRGGDDLIVAAAGDDTLRGGAGVDALDPGTGHDFVDPGSDFDDPEVQDVPAQVVGAFTLVPQATAFNDTMYLATPDSVFPANATDRVVWSFEGLIPGDYELLATWTPNPTAASNARFVVNGLLDRTVDQRLAPTGRGLLGFSWASLGQISFSENAPFVVELQAAGADGQVMADAVRLVRVGQVPQIEPLPDLTIGESESLFVPVTVTYPLGALEDIEFSLRDAPQGAVLSAAMRDPASGSVTATLEWPASAGRETGSFLITISAKDRAHPTRSDEQSFWVTIGQPNATPQLAPISEQTVGRGTVVTTQFTATDPDGPAWDLRYTLGAGTPAGASIDATSGWFSWDTSTVALGSYVVRVIVTDRGNPPKSDQFDWTLTVIDAGLPASLLTPQAQTLPEDSWLEFAAVNGNGLSVNAATSAEFTLGLVADNGTLELPPASGVTYELGDMQPASRVKLRGSAAALNQALAGLRFMPAENFRGTTELRVELLDKGSVLRGPHVDVALIPIVVVPQADPPVVPAQTLYFTPNTVPGGLQVVGTVLAEDPDPDQWLTFRLVGGNGDFRIDSGTGQLIAAHDQVLPAGETTIQVEAYYELSPTHVGQGTITIHRVPDANSAPFVAYDSYSLSEDALITGNLVAGDNQGGQADGDFDFDDIALFSVHDIRGKPIPFGVPSELPSGASFVVHPDGSFTLDASVSRQLDAGYFGSTYEEIQYSIVDEHGATSNAGLARFFIDHVNDPPELWAQTISLTPKATADSRVGRVFAVNAEPDESLYYQVLSGNTNNTFALNGSSGELTLTSAASLVAGHVFHLVVEVRDEESLGVSTTVTIHVTENQVPVVPNAGYITAADLPLSGNVFEDLTGNGPAYDPDGNLLTLVAVDGEAFGVGRIMVLPSGARLRLNADGSFEYDPTSSATFQRLASGDQRDELFVFTTRDAEGATVDAALKITVAGRNLAPRAFDNLYALLDDERLTGNVIDDFGAFDQRDRDDNNDPLTLIEVDGIAVSSSLDLTTRRGASVRVDPEGGFEYDPAGVNIAGLEPGDRLFDGFFYQVADPAGRTALAVARFEIEIGSTPHDPVWIAGVGLVNDTSSLGGSDDDGRSEDPRIEGTIAGTTEGADHFVIEFDVDAATAGGALQTVNELSVDAFLTLSANDASFPRFEFDPSIVTGFGSYGNKSLAFRVKAFGPQNNLLGTSSWDYYQFEWLQMLDSGPIRLETIRLFNDTASIDDDGQPAGQDDLTTTDPRIYALVGGNFDVPPLAAGDSREVRLEFEHQRNASVFQNSITVSAAQSVLYDPREVDPGLRDDFTGTLSIDYTVSLVQVLNGVLSVTEIAADTLQFYYFSVPADCGVVSIEEVPPGPAGYQGSVRDVIGSVIWSCTPQEGQAFVEFDYADANGNFDELPDGDVGVVIDSSSAPSQATFEYTAIGLPGTQPQIRARAKIWSYEYGAFQPGSWSPSLSLSEPTAPGIAEMVLDQTRMDGRELRIVRGHLVGSIDDDPGGEPHDLGAVGFIELELFHRDPSEFVFSDSWPVDGNIITDAWGRFSYQPDGLAYDTEYRIWARTRVTLTDGSTVYGAPTFLGEHVWLPAPILPTIEQLQLFDPIAAQFVAGRWLTPDTRLTGSVRQDDPTGIAGPNVQIEFAHDYLSVVGDEQVVAGIAIVESDSSFHYAPLLAAGDVDVMARVAFFDDPTGTIIRGPWFSFPLELSVETSSNEPALVREFQLANPLPGPPGVPHVGTPTVIGRVINPDGYVEYVRVEFRDASSQAIVGSSETDGSGRFTYELEGLATGMHSIDARAYEWDYVSQQIVPGPWTSGGGSLNFVLDEPATREIASFGLLSDTGAIAGTTANPTLVGTLSGPGPFELLTVAIDHQDDGTMDAMVQPDPEGWFVYSPEALPFGLQTFRAKLATWQSDLQAFTYSTGVATTFILEYQPDGPAQFASIGLAHPGSPVTDPTIVGRIIDDRQLEDVTIEFDFDGNDANGINARTSTDPLGQFSLTPRLPQNGPTNVRARTRQLDATGTQYLTSDWTLIPPFDFQPNDNLPPTLSLELLNSNGGNPPVVTDATVFGYLQNDGPLEGIRIEFSWSENWAVIGTTQADHFGYFEFEPGGLTAGQQFTLWARPREPLGGSGTEFQFGPAIPVTFVYQGDTYSDLHVAQLGLRNDTATPGGSTPHDGSTEIAVLAGRVAWSAGNVDGLTVEFDVDGDFQPEGSAWTDGNGDFEFDPAPTEPGFYSVRARVLYPNFGTSDWKIANFVFDIDDSSPQALTLVHALAILDSDWQSAEDLNFASIHVLADDLYSASDQNVESEYQYAVTMAGLVKSGIERSVDQEYEQAQLDAQASYEQQVDVAYQVFLAELSGLPVDQRPTFRLRAFAWPARPLGNEMSVPTEDSLPRPPRSPGYQGPNFDPFQDPGYRLAVWQAEQSYLVDVRAAEQWYAAQRAAPYQQYRDDVSAATADYDEAIRQAGEAFQMAREDHPSLDDTQFGALADALQSAWQAYRNIWQSAHDSWQLKFDHAWERRGQALFNAAADYQEASYCENDPPTIAGANACADRVHRANIEYDARTRRINAEFDRTMAAADKQLTVRIANALHTARVAAADLDKQMAVIVRQHRHESLADQLYDAQDYETAQAAAQAELTNRLAIAEEHKAKALADLLFEKQQRIAEARQERELSISEAQFAAVLHWSMIVASPWGAYRVDLGQLELGYREQLIGLEYDRDLAIAAAERFEAYTIADARQDRSHGTAEAEELRSTSLSELRRDMRIDVDAAIMQRDIQIAGEWATYRGKLADAAHERALDTAEEVEDYEIKVADANQANHQPSDLYHVRCIPGEVCNYPYSGYEGFVYEDNSGVRERNARTHRRRVAGAARDLELAQAGIDHGFESRRIDAMWRYRRQANMAARDATLAQADIHFDYQVDVAAAQDDYDLSLATAVADYTVQLAVAEAGREYRTIAADQQFDAGAAVQKRSLDTLSAMETRDFQVGQAHTHLADVTAWSTLYPGPWSAFQVSLATAELNRVAAIQGAAASYADRNASINAASIRSETQAQLDFAYEVFGSDGARVTQAATIAEAYVDLAANNALYDFVSAQAQAQRSHDVGVAHESFAYRSAVINAEATRDREVSRAVRQRRGLVARANYARAIDPENTNLSELTNEAYQGFIRRTASANLELVLSRESARLNWKIAVGELNVQQVRDIVAAQLERAERLREDAVILASAEADAAIRLVADESSAAVRRHQTLAQTEAAETVYSAQSSAMQSLEVALAEGQFQWSQGVARSDYEVELYRGHMLATQAYQLATGSSTAAYYADLAASRYAQAIQDGAATSAYYQTLAQGRSSYQLLVGAAGVEHAMQIAATNVAYTQAQTSTDHAAAVSVAHALGQLHVKTQTAKAVLQLGNVEAQSADVTYAEAARDRDNAIARADHDRVGVLAPAQADLTVACATFWWFWSESCEEQQEIYDEIRAEADQRFADARERAEQKFERRVDVIESRENDDRGSRRRDYVTAIEDAKLASASGRAQVLEATAVASSRNDISNAYALAMAGSRNTTLLATAESQHILQAGQALVERQQQIRDAAVAYAYAAGNAEAAFQIHQSATNAAAWQLIAAANPADTYLQFRAAESAATAAWTTQLAPFIVTYRGLSESVLRQSELDAAVLNTSHEARRALVDRDHTTRLAQLDQAAKITGVLQALTDATFAVQNQNQLAIDTASSERTHALASLAADVHHETALKRIQQQYAHDQDLEALQQATKEARFGYDSALAQADATWRTQLAEHEAVYSAAEIERTDHAERDAARLNRDWQVARATAEYTRTMALAQGQADLWIDDNALTTLRHDQAAQMKADLWSADYAARTTATGILESRLNLPWASFEHQRAVAQQIAWNHMQADYLAWQHDWGTQQSDYDALRASRYLTTTSALALADLDLATQGAELVADMAWQTAGQQREFATRLSQETQAYREQLTQAEFEYDRAVAKAHRDGTNTMSAENERSMALHLAEDQYRQGYGQLSRLRREGVAQAGFLLSASSSQLQHDHAAVVSTTQAALNTALMAAYYDVANDSGLEAERAALQHTFLVVQAASLVSSLGGIAASPWATLALAEANAQQAQVVNPLAELQADQRRQLAAARVEHHLAVTGAALTRSTGLTQLDAWVDTMQAAGQFALVATYEDGQLPLPADIDPPTPDLGPIARTTIRVSTTYPEIQEIDYYGHPGIYTYWGANLWWGTTYSDVAWLWSNYGYYDYGWNGLNYTGVYNGFGGYYGSGFFGGYYGYWTYAPWTFGWFGWTGGYLPPPSGLSPDATIDVQLAVDRFQNSVVAATDHSTQTQVAISEPEDTRAPQVDALLGSVQLGDTSTTFHATPQLQTVGAEGLADFTDTPNTQRLEAHARDLPTLTKAVVEPTPTSGAGAATGANADGTAKDADARFLLRLEGRAAFIVESELSTRRDLPDLGYAPQRTTVPRATHLVGFVDKNGWVNFTGLVGYGRARLTALRRVAETWNSTAMKDLLQTAFAAEPGLRSDKPLLQQVADGARSPYQVQDNSVSIGIFIGGTNMHFYGVGNVERMYNQFVGTKFYYGGIGNSVDSKHPVLEGGSAVFEFFGNLKYMLADIRRYGREKQIQIFGWSRGAAQAAELARWLGGEGITVEFVGMFDPVYSLDRPGQSSSLITRTQAGKAGNYVTRKLAPNIQTAVAIYAMNETRSWFPATRFNRENANTTWIPIGSPGAHGEIGGHWQSNAYVQQLNFHVMMKYAEDHSSADFAYWDSDTPVTLDPYVERIYQSDYTTYAALKSVEKDVANEAPNYLTSWKTEIGLWRGYSAPQFVREANSSEPKKWKPSKLATQDDDNGINLAFALEVQKKFVLGPWGDWITGDNPVDVKQDYRNQYRRRLEWVLVHLWDVYPGIDDSFMRELYERVIDPDAGGWKN